MEVAGVASRFFYLHGRNGISRRVQKYYCIALATYCTGTGIMQYRYDANASEGDNRQQPQGATEPL